MGFETHRFLHFPVRLLFELDIKVHKCYSNSLIVLMENNEEILEG